jgi:hypothetical protein
VVDGARPPVGGLSAAADGEVGPGHSVAGWGAVACAMWGAVTGGGGVGWPPVGEARAGRLNCLVSTRELFRDALSCTYLVSVPELPVVAVLNCPR